MINFISKDGKIIDAFKRIPSFNHFMKLLLEFGSCLQIKHEKYENRKIADIRMGFLHNFVICLVDILEFVIIRESENQKCLSLISENICIFIQNIQDSNANYQAVCGAMKKLEKMVIYKQYLQFEYSMVHGDTKQFENDVWIRVLHQLNRQASANTIIETVQANKQCVDLMNNSVYLSANDRANICQQIGFGSTISSQRLTLHDYSLPAQIKI